MNNMMNSASENSTKCLKGCQSGINESKEHMADVRSVDNSEEPMVTEKAVETNVVQNSVGIEKPHAEMSSKKSKSKRQRCHKCNKKCGLMIFQCKCEGAYCIDHKGTTEHGCAYDYRTEMQQRLLKKSEKVSAVQITKF